jgi:hypothetical protein
VRRLRRADNLTAMCGVNVTSSESVLFYCTSAEYGLFINYDCFVYKCALILCHVMCNMCVWEFILCVFLSFGMA